VWDLKREEQRRGREEKEIGEISKVPFPSFLILSKKTPHEARGKKWGFARQTRIIIEIWGVFVPMSVQTPFF